MRELATLVTERCFFDLDAPIARLAPTHAPVPYAPSLERAWLPDAGAIADAVRRLAQF